MCVEQDNSPTLSRTSSRCSRTSPAYPAHDASRCQTPHQPHQLQQNMFLSWVQDPFLLRSQERLAAGLLACIVSTMKRSLFVIGRLPSHRTIHASVQHRIGIRMLQAKNLGDRSRNEGARPGGAVQQERAPKKLVLQPLNSTALSTWAVNLQDSLYRGIAARVLPPHAVAAMDGSPGSGSKPRKLKKDEQREGVDAAAVSLTAAAAASGEDVVKVGILLKRSQNGLVHNWRRRFVVLREKLLFYYESPESVKPQGACSHRIDCQCTQSRFLYEPALPHHAQV